VRPRDDGWVCGNAPALQRRCSHPPGISLGACSAPPLLERAADVDRRRSREVARGLARVVPPYPLKDFCDLAHDRAGFPIGAAHSSAVNKRCGGIVNPNALAVLKVDRRLPGWVNVTPPESTYRIPGPTYLGASPRASANVTPDPLSSARKSNSVQRIIVSVGDGVASVQLAVAHSGCRDSRVEGIFVWPRNQIL
jgi:hypothetical protein